MLSFQLTHNEFTFASVIMMSQAGAIFAYMLRVRVKSESRAAFFLRLFFAFVFLQALVLFVIHGFAWGKALLPFHHLAIVMAGFGLMHFVHHIPKCDQPQLLKLGALIVILLALFIAQYSLGFAYQYLYEWEPGLKVAPFYWSLLPTGSVVFVIGVLIRAVRFIPLPTTQFSRIGRFRHTLKSFLTPPNPDVQALRDVAIALLLVFLTAASIFLDLSQSTLIFVLVVGCLLAIFMIALVYVNHAPEPTTFIVKLVGISLFALLTICGWLGLRNIESLRQRIDSQRHSDTELVREMMRGGRLSALPNEVLYVVAWLSEVNEINAILPHYVRSQAELEIKQLVWQNMVEVENIYDIGQQRVESYTERVEDRISKKNTHSYLFVLAGTTYEVGFSADEFQEEMNQEVNALVAVVITSSGALILLLPLFFRTNLVSPLNNLLAGVERANAGELDIAVRVRYQDEIGFLTDSFNGMIQSLAESAQARDNLNAALQRSNETLELRVRERTAELAQAVDSAERANRAKSVFLATMTHELRTPLNGILGYTQILRRNPDTTPKQQDGLSIIEHSGKHLLTLINDVLDLAKIESGKVELLESEFHLPIFLKGIGELMRVRAEQKGIAFHLELSEALPTRLYTDERRLRQVLLNLLSNAVKFTPSGSVRLRVGVRGSGFGVRDSGFRKRKSELGVRELGRGRRESRVGARNQDLAIQSLAESSQSGIKGVSNDSEHKYRIPNPESRTPKGRKGVKDDNVLQGVESLAESSQSGTRGVSGDSKLSKGREIRSNSPNEKGGDLDTFQYRRGVGKEEHEGIRSLSGNSKRIVDGVGNATDHFRETKLSTQSNVKNLESRGTKNQPDAQWTNNEFRAQDLAVNDLEPQIPNPESRTPNPESRTPNLEPRTPNPESRITFAIIDTGSGIAQDELEQIFKPFEQASREDQAKGTGLGLPISRHLVQLLGGELQVTSQVGVGSQFSFELPLSLPRSLTTSPPPLRHLAQESSSRLIPSPFHLFTQKPSHPFAPLLNSERYKILVVDDNLNNRGVVRDLLSPLGFEIIEAENGDEGLRRSLLDAPSLLITDLVMPGGIDGFELIQRIRQSERSELPIIAASASVYEEDHQKSITLGADAFVHKPIDADLLLGELARLLELESQPGAKRLAMVENERLNEAKALILPPPSRLVTLLDLASLGDVAALREELAELSQQDKQFKPFVSQMQPLLQAFAINQICKLLEEYLE